MSREVEVRKFLQVILSSKKLSDAAEEELEGWMVNFTHFCRLEFTPDRAILARCWAQRAALYMPAGEEGIDLLITIKKETAFATLRVQVKNYKNPIGGQTVADFLNKLDVQCCAPLTPHKDEPFSIGLLLQVGEGDVEFSCGLEKLGRVTRLKPQPKARQLRLACAVSGTFAESIRSLAGKSLNNENFNMSSEEFREGRWFKPIEDDDEDV